MKINIDTPNPNEESYMLTEERIMWRIARALIDYSYFSKIDLEITTIPFSQINDLTTYDVCLWSHQPILARAKQYPGFSDCINILFAHGITTYDGDIDGVLYVVKKGFDSDPGHKHKILLNQPFKLSYHRKDTDGNYVLISGGVFPIRALHIALWAMRLAKYKLGSECPELIVVCQPSILKDWSDRDPGLFYRDFFLSELDSLSKIVDVTRLDAMPVRNFQTLLSGALCYVFTASGINTTVTQEALCLGVPLIAQEGNIEYTNNFLIYQGEYDWLKAIQIANCIDAIINNGELIRANAATEAERIRRLFDPEGFAKEFLRFIAPFETRSGK